jgi:hypothetical protein
MTGWKFEFRVCEISLFQWVLSFYLLKKILFKYMPLSFFFFFFSSRIFRNINCSPHTQQHKQPFGLLSFSILRSSYVTVQIFLTTRLALNKNNPLQNPLSFAILVCTYHNRPIHPHKINRQLSLKWRGKILKIYFLRLQMYEN